MTICGGPRANVGAKWFRFYAKHRRTPGCTCIDVMSSYEAAPVRKTIPRYPLIALCVLSAFYFSFAKQWISFSIRDRSFTEYSAQTLQVAAAEHRPQRDVRSLLLIKAEELAIPLTFNEIEITGDGRNMRIALSYEEAIILPFLKRPIYRMKFDHDIDAISLLQ